MSGAIRNPHVQTLCTLAQDDESTLQLPLPDQIFGFHAQQSCEKLFKALIASCGRTYPFTHSLEMLTDLLQDCGETLPATPYDPLLLEPFAVELRYDIGGKLAESEKQDIRETVAILRQHVLVRVVELDDAHTP